MNRDLKKMIDEYERRFTGKTNEGAFYIQDFEQIASLSTEQTGGDRVIIDGYSFSLIANALRAGFMVGYRKGVRDQRHKNKMRKDGNR